jgi:hypothetical protein
MCVDYTDLKKHCLKDPFGLPRIDQVIDSTVGCDLLCFLDCYFGYHQIAIKEEDQEKTAFIVVVSTAIVVERQEDGHAYPVQRPVYFVSEILSESKARYQPIQNLLYEVLITSRKLRHYFQEYSISVITDYPLGDILRNKDANGRISKRAVELGALNIDFMPRAAIKSQALVDFMAEWR